MEFYQHIPVAGNTKELKRSATIKTWIPQISSTIPNHQSHRVTQMPKEQGPLMKVHVNP
jgi:hypothetical protein